MSELQQVAYHREFKTGRRIYLTSPVASVYPYLEYTTPRDTADSDDQVKELFTAPDESSPVRQVSAVREACKPTQKQKDERVDRNTTSRTLSRGERYEYKSDDGRVWRDTDKVRKVSYHHSHGLHGRKRVKPGRTTIRGAHVEAEETYIIFTRAPILIAFPRRPR